MFNTGQVTLPKKWRNQFQTNKFIAKPRGNKLVIEALEDQTPEQLLDENVELYEKIEDGEKVSGIRFKKGLGKEALNYFQNALKNA